MQNWIHGILTNHDTSVFMKIYLPVNISIKEGDCNASHSLTLCHLESGSGFLDRTTQTHYLKSRCGGWSFYFQSFTIVQDPHLSWETILSVELCVSHTVLNPILTAVLKLILFSIRIATNSLQTKQRLDLNNTMFNLILYPTQPFPQVKKTQSQLDFCLILLKDIF